MIITIEDNGKKDVYVTEKYFLMIDEINNVLSKNVVSLGFHSNINRLELLAKLEPLIDLIIDELGD